MSKRQVFDLPATRLWVQEHRLITHQCRCGCEATGQFPADVTAPVQYGPRIQAQSVLLNVDYRIPFAKVRQFWADLTGYAYNPATLISTQTTLQAQLAPIDEQIKEPLKAAHVCHVDETGVRVEGKIHWLLVASNESYTHLFVHPKRGKDALLSEQSVFGDCLNWTGHDCGKSYVSVGKGRHALCGAHLLRQLAGLMESGSVWAKQMHGFLLEAYKASRQGPQAGKRFIGETAMGKSASQKLAFLSATRLRLNQAYNLLAVPVAEQETFISKSLQKTLKRNVAKSLTALKEEQKIVEQQIKELIQADTGLKELFDLMVSVPGIGPVIATELLLATNEMQAINDPKKMACHAGVAPFDRAACAVSFWQ